MANGYDCGVEMRTLEKKIKDFTYRHGYDLARVFDDLLDYIISFFDIERKPIEGWRYTADENAAFHDMMADYFRILDEQINKEQKPWYDAWGDLFMSLHAGGGGRGQFFTPDCICNLMSEVTVGRQDEPEATRTTTFGKRVTVNDCAAGSSRNLLAAHAVFMKNGWRKPYLSAEDVDLTCCKMSAVNMAVHGCFGEVVCHDTLIEPCKVKAGFMVNEALWPLPGLPSIRRINDPMRFVSTALWIEKQRRFEQGQQQPEVESRPANDAVEMKGRQADKPKERKPPQQLSLW